MAEPRQPDAPGMGEQLELTEAEMALARIDGAAPPAPVALFPRDPVKAIQEMRGLVTMMNDLVKSLPKKVQKKYVASIDGRPYPCVTWWTTIALPLQLVPQIAWTRRIDTAEDSGYVKETWHARCEVVHTPSGNIIATGEGICSGEETQWSRTENKYVDRWTDNHAIHAMSQTRAIGRTFRQCLAGLAVMAGLEATPAEEMTDKMRRDRSKAKAAPADEITRIAYSGEPIDADELPTDKWIELFPITDVRRGWFRVEHINGGFKIDNAEPPDDAVEKVAVVCIKRSGRKNDKPWAIVTDLRYAQEAANAATGQAGAPSGAPGDATPDLQAAAEPPASGSESETPSGSAPAPPAEPKPLPKELEAPAAAEADAAYLDKIKDQIRDAKVILTAKLGVPRTTAIFDGLKGAIFGAEPWKSSDDAAALAEFDAELRKNLPKEE